MPRVSGSAWPWLLADDSDAIVGVRSGNIDQLFVFSNDDALNIDMSNLAATWNSAGTTYNAIKMNVTDTASAAASLLLDLQVGGVSQFRVTKTGAITAGTLALGSLTGLGTGVATFLATPSSANLISAVTDETGTGALVFATSPTLTTPNIGAATGTSITLSGRATIDTLTVGRGGQTAVTENTALGFGALNSASLTGGYNTAVGYKAGEALTSGAYNTFVGWNCGLSVTNGNNNVGINRQSLQNTTTGGNNTAINFALINNTTGSSNHSVGAGSLLFNTTGSNNCALGEEALLNNLTGNNSTAIGFEALQRFVASQNTALGYRALRGGDATPANNTGTNNIGIGYQAGDAITTGSTNIVIGHDIDVDSATGSNQINIGDRYFHDRIRLLERSSDPAKPAEGNMIVWMSDGTGLGDDGDVIIASTAGGVTNYAILFDHSAGTLWS